MVVIRIIILEDINIKILYKLHRYAANHSERWYYVCIVCRTMPSRLGIRVRSGEVVLSVITVKHVTGSSIPLVDYISN